MNPESVPVLGLLFRWGPGDRGFDALMVLGPLVVLIVTVVGRSPVTTAIAGGYLAGLVGYVLYRALAAHRA